MAGWGWEAETCPSSENYIGGSAHWWRETSRGSGVSRASGVMRRSLLEDHSNCFRVNHLKAKGSEQAQCFPVVTTVETREGDCQAHCRGAAWSPHPLPALGPQGWGAEQTGHLPPSSTDPPSQALTLRNLDLSTAGKGEAHPEGCPAHGLQAAHGPGWL